MVKSCPRCHVVDTLIVERKSAGKLRCEKCDYLCTDDETDILFGLKKITCDNKVSYESIGEDWQKFPSWYCLKFFDSFEGRVAHDKKYHKEGEFQLGMLPSGFTTDKKRTCD